MASSTYIRVDLMIISVINHHESGIADNNLLEAIRAINRQITHDFRPYWNLSGELRLGGKKGPRAPRQQETVRGDAVIYLFSETRKDRIDRWTAGYHFKETDGIPTAYIYVQGGDMTDWSVSLSHEALELIANPLVNLFVRGPHPGPNAERDVFHSFEVCDAVKEEFYLVDGKKVSNFLLPLYFTREGQNHGRIVYRDREGASPLTSFGLNPGGYIPFYDSEDGNQFFHYHLVKTERDEYCPQMFKVDPMAFESTKRAQYRSWRYEERAAEMVTVKPSPRRRAKQPRQHG
jgi:hypothetical protein